MVDGQTIDTLKKELEAHRRRISELAERAEKCDKAMEACRHSERACKEAESQLQRERSLLELRVQERTVELSGINRALREEIAERIRVEKTLAESEAQYREVVQNANSVILRMDPKGNIIFMNDFGLRFFGYTKDEMLGHNVIGLIVPAASAYGRDLPKMIRDIGEHTERYISNENENIRSNGERVWVAWTNKAVMDRDGHIVEVLCIGNDITELKSAEEELRKARDELEQRVRERTAELSSINTELQSEIRDRIQAEKELLDAKEQAELYIDLIAHDINNINQVAMGYLEMARDGLGLDKESLVFVQKPLDMLNRSSELISNVRKLQQIRKAELPMQMIDIGRILDETVVRCSRFPGREIRIHYTPVHDVFVMANELLQDVFENIVGNSIKHSQGPLDVYIDVGSVTEGDKKYYRVSIADNGPGINDKLKAGLFVYRRTYKPDGHGLGLYLVHSLVDSFSGRISVADRVPGEPGKGARLIVLLPAAPASMEKF